MDREFSMEKVEQELRELVRLAEHYGHATSRTEVEALRLKDTKQTPAQAEAKERKWGEVAQKLGTQTYTKLKDLLQLIDRVRAEAYNAGVSDGERGELGRVEGSR